MFKRTIRVHTNDPSQKEIRLVVMAYILDKKKKG